MALSKFAMQSPHSTTCHEDTDSQALAFESSGSEALVFSATISVASGHLEIWAVGWSEDLPLEAQVPFLLVALQGAPTPSLGLLCMTALCC